MEFLISSLLLITCYIIGAIPTGYLIARSQGIDDIRKKGSGNIGATNVARVLGFHFFLLIFVIDASKAFLCSRLVLYLSESYEFTLIASLMILIGNCFSYFLGGIGGKGVATAVGLSLALTPSLFPLVLIIWLLFFAVTRTVGISSVGAALCMPCIMIIMGYSFSQCLFFSLVALLILSRHTSNIKNYFAHR